MSFMIIYIPAEIAEAMCTTGVSGAHFWLRKFLVLA